MNSKEFGTRSFIQRKGRVIRVDATFWVTESASVNATEISLNDPIGLLPGTILYFGSLRIFVDYPTESGAILSQPLRSSIPAGSLLTLSSDSWGLFGSSGRDTTRDSMEFNRRVRVPTDLVIPPGATVTDGLSRYLVSGYQLGDSSFTIRLKLANATLDLYTPNPAFSEGSEDTDSVTWGSENKTWPAQQPFILSQGGIPAYQEQLSSTTDLKEPGYVSKLGRTYTVPRWFNISVGDVLKESREYLRVSSIDHNRLRNLQALYVDYYKGVLTDG